MPTALNIKSGTQRSRTTFNEKMRIKTTGGKLEVEMALSSHDQVVLAMAKVFIVYGFDVTYDIKGIANKMQGDSGITYYPDIVARKGPVSILCETQTKERRTTRARTSRNAVQMLQAELDDLIVKLKRPRGMIVDPDGIEKDAEQLAKHFGIYLVHLPLEVAKQIVDLDSVSQRQKMIEIARNNKIEF